MILEDETVSIKIPAGVVDGMQLKFLIKEMMPGNSVPGDLIVAIEELEHEFLKRRRKLALRFIHQFSEAVLGVSKDIETLMKSNWEGIQSGKILKIKGKVPSINGYGNGDLLVHVNVWT
jgi:molecular chaperone DnaJ